MYCSKKSRSTVFGYLALSFTVLTSNLSSLAGIRLATPDKVIEMAGQSFVIYNKNRIFSVFPELSDNEKVSVIAVLTQQMSEVRDLLEKPDTEIAKELSIPGPHLLNTRVRDWLFFRFATEAQIEALLERGRSVEFTHRLSWPSLAAALKDAGRPIMHADLNQLAVQALANADPKIQTWAIEVLQYSSKLSGIKLSSNSPELVKGLLQVFQHGKDVERRRFAFQVLSKILDPHYYKLDKQDQTLSKESLMRVFYDVVNNDPKPEFKYHALTLANQIIDRFGQFPDLSNAAEQVADQLTNSNNLKIRKVAFGFLSLYAKRSLPGRATSKTPWNDETKAATAKYVLLLIDSLERETDEELSSKLVDELETTVSDLREGDPDSEGLKQYQRFSRAILSAFNYADQFALGRSQLLMSYLGCFRKGDCSEERASSEDRKRQLKSLLDQALSEVSSTQTVPDHSIASGVFHFIEIELHGIDTLLDKIVEHDRALWTVFLTRFLEISRTDIAHNHKNLEARAYYATETLIKNWKLLTDTNRAEVIKHLAERRVRFDKPEDYSPKYTKLEKLLETTDPDNYTKFRTQRVEALIQRFKSKEYDTATRRNAIRELHEEYLKNSYEAELGSKYGDTALIDRIGQGLLECAQSKGDAQIRALAIEYFPTGRSSVKTEHSMLSLVLDLLDRGVRLTTADRRAFNSPRYLEEVKESKYSLPSEIDVLSEKLGEFLLPFEPAITGLAWAAATKMLAGHPKSGSAQALSKSLVEEQVKTFIAKTYSIVRERPELSSAWDLAFETAFFLARDSRSESSQALLKEIQHGRYRDLDSEDFKKGACILTFVPPPGLKRDTDASHDDVLRLLIGL